MDESALLSRYFKNNKIINIPKKHKNKILLFEYIIGLFDKEKVYSEKEVNTILERLYPDYVLLRRYLIDYKFLFRDDYGKEYRVNAQETVN